VSGGLSGLIGLRPTLFTMAGLAVVGVVVAWTSPLVAASKTGFQGQPEGSAVA
jgi:hypothetical protein